MVTLCLLCVFQVRARKGSKSVMAAWAHRCKPLSVKVVPQWPGRCPRVAPWVGLVSAVEHCTDIYPDYVFVRKDNQMNAAGGGMSGMASGGQRLGASSFGGQANNHMLGSTNMMGRISNS